MKFSAYLVCFFLFFSSIILAQNMTIKDTVTYSMGLILAQDLNASGIDEINTDILMKAITDHMKGETLVDANQAQAIVREYKVTAVKEMGAKFLEENGKKDGVTTLPSGLQYSVLTKGLSTEKPAPTSTVTTHYHGTLINGTVFDSSVERGEPISFPLNRVIKGWQEGLQLMSPGDKYRFYIPYDLAYGERGAGGQIPPYATLIFDVELISFK